MILIVNGACGVGKSTVTKKLEEKFEACAHIKADDVHCFIVNSKIIPEHIQMTDINIESLVKNFKSNGFKNIIIDNVYETTEHINCVVSNLKQYDKDVFSVLLYCELQENIRRDSLRPFDDVCGEQRVRELHEILYNEEGLGIIFDNTNIPEEIMATNIFEFVQMKLKEKSVYATN